MELELQINEKRCQNTKEEHTLQLPQCCPISKNPQPGSRITISYAPNVAVLEVAALKGYIESYRGGKGEIRSMEGMVQSIARDCATILGVKVKVVADLIIEPGQQKMIIKCKHQ